MITKCAIIEENGMYNILDIEDYQKKAFEGERLLTFNLTKDIMRKLLGRSLTIIDASIQNERQNKSAKDLVKQVFSDELGALSEMAFDQEELQELIEDTSISVDVETVPVEKVLGLEE